MSKKIITVLLLLLLLLFSACGSTQSEQFAEYNPVECNEIATILPNAVSAPTKFGTATGVQMVLNWQNSDVTFHCIADVGSFSTEKCQSTIDLHPGETLTWYSSAMDMDINFPENYITLCVRDGEHVVGYAHIYIKFSTKRPPYEAFTYRILEAYKYPKDGDKYQNISEQLLHDKYLNHTKSRALSALYSAVFPAAELLESFDPLTREKTTLPIEYSSRLPLKDRTVVEGYLFAEFLSLADGNQVVVSYNTICSPDVFIIHSDNSVLYYQGTTGAYFSGKLNMAN